MRTAFSFLQENAYINFGLLDKDLQQHRQQQQQHAKEQPGEGQEAAGQQQQQGPDERTIVFKLYDILKESDLNVRELGAANTTCNTA